MKKKKNLSMSIEKEQDGKRKRKDGKTTETK